MLFFDHDIFYFRQHRKEIKKNFNKVLKTFEKSIEMEHLSKRANAPFSMIFSKT